MAKFRGAELVCQVCGSRFKVPPSRASKATTCSHPCSVIYRARGLMRPKVEITCRTCGKPKMVHKSFAATQYCSNACKHAHPDLAESVSRRVKGEGNPMWKGGLAEHCDGYTYERCEGHPFTKTPYVFQHRLVVERHLRQTNPSSEWLIEVDGELYLNPELAVHHVNQDRRDNRIENLQVLTNSEHQKLHNRLRAQQKNGGNHDFS